MVRHFPLSAVHLPDVVEIERSRGMSTTNNNIYRWKTRRSSYVHLDGWYDKGWNTFSNFDRLPNLSLVSWGSSGSRNDNTPETGETFPRIMTALTYAKNFRAAFRCVFPSQYELFGKGVLIPFRFLEDCTVAIWKHAIRNQQMKWQTTIFWRRVFSSSSICAKPCPSSLQQAEYVFIVLEQRNLTV